MSCGGGCDDDDDVIFERIVVEDWGGIDRPDSFIIPAGEWACIAIGGDSEAESVTIRDREYGDIVLSAGKPWVGRLRSRDKIQVLPLPNNHGTVADAGDLIHSLELLCWSKLPRIIPAWPRNPYFKALASTIDLDAGALTLLTEAVHGTKGTIPYFGRKAGYLMLQQQGDTTVEWKLMAVYRNGGSEVEIQVYPTVGASAVLAINAAESYIVSELRCQFLRLYAKGAGTANLKWAFEATDEAP